MKSEICMPYERSFLIKTRSRRNQCAFVAARWSSIVATFVLLTCLFSVGCASNREDKSSSQAALRVTVLGDSIEPLRKQFNADKDKLRVLALLSPT